MNGARQRTPKPARRSCGLTLIELCIALAVLAILSAIAVPGLAAQLARQRLHSTAQTLVADLADARFEATRRGQALHWQAGGSGDGSAGWCWALSALPDCPCGQPQGCQIRNVVAADHPGVRLQRTGGTLALPPVGAAAGNGTAARADVAVFGNSRGDTLRVQVLALGRPQVCADAASAKAWPRLPAC